MNNIPTPSQWHERLRKWPGNKVTRIINGKEKEILCKPGYPPVPEPGQEVTYNKQKMCLSEEGFKFHMQSVLVNRARMKYKEEQMKQQPNFNEHPTDEEIHEYMKSQNFQLNAEIEFKKGVGFQKSKPENPPQPRPPPLMSKLNSTKGKNTFSVGAKAPINTSWDQWMKMRKIGCTKKIYSSWVKEVK